MFCLHQVSILKSHCTFPFDARKEKRLSRCISSKWRTSDVANRHWRFICTFLRLHNLVSMQLMLSPLLFLSATGRSGNGNDRAAIGANWHSKPCLTSTLTVTLLYQQEWCTKRASFASNCLTNDADRSCVWACFTLLLDLGFSRLTQAQKAP